MVVVVLHVSLMVMQHHDKVYCKLLPCDRTHGFVCIFPFEQNTGVNVHTLIGKGTRFSVYILLWDGVIYNKLYHDVALYLDCLNDTLYPDGRPGVLLHLDGLNDTLYPDGRLGVLDNETFYPVVALVFYCI
jgi:hypothetical protein